MKSNIFAILKKVPQRTQLSALSDLETAIDDAQSYYSSSDIEKLDNLDNNLGDFQDLKNSLAFKANEIYDTVSDWETISDQLTDSLQFLKSALDQYAILSEDLGFDPNQESVFVEGEDYIQEIESLLSRFETEYNNVPMDDINRFAE